MGGERESLSRDELAIVLSHFDLGVVQDVQDFPRGSHLAPKLVVQTTRGRYLLKRRPAGRNDASRVAFAHDLQRFLAEKYFPLPKLIRTREGGDLMVRHGENLYEVFEFLPGDRYDGTFVATYEAGKALGLYHRLVRDYRPQWQPPGGHYHLAPVVHSQLRELPQRLAAAESVRGREQELRRTCEFLLEAYEIAGQAAEGEGLLKWEQQIVHSDWHPGNILFRAGHVVAVIDYDAARIQQRVMDIANGVLQFSLETATRDPETWPDEADRARAKRFLRGYDEADVLTAAELSVVPLLMQEAFIAEVVVPIWKTGTFARIDGFRFLKMVVRKIRWLQQNRQPLVEGLDD